MVDTDRRVLEYTVTYSGLAGPVTAAGFGRVARDPTDPVLVAPVDPKAGSIHAIVTLTAAQIADLNGGRWFFDIRTSANPAGEIRGVVYRTSGD